MAAYAQFGYGYPSANQLLGGAAATTTGDSQSGHGGGGSMPSPLSGTNEASLSPSGGSTTTGITGPVSPGAISQSSNNALPTVATASATSPTDPDAVGNDVTGATEADAVAGGGIGIGGGGASALEAHVRLANSMSCCENGRPIITDPVSGQTVCSCQYDSARLTLGGYSRMPIPSAGVGVYGGPYPSNEQNPYPSIGVDNSAFYSPLSNPYGMKDASSSSDMNAWTSAGLQSTSGYYSYDPTLAAYGYGPNYDLASRRKNATRESTATLKAWLSEHKKNPYPTKGEKIMLAIITKMTLTQVSTWFANARRRLKKENKMTWEPKNKTEDDDDGLMSDDEKEKDVVGAAAEGTKLQQQQQQAAAAGDTFDPGNQRIKSEIGKSDKDLEIEEKIEREPQNLLAIRGLPPYGSANFNPHPSHPAHPSHPYNPYLHQQQQQQLEQQQQQQQEQQQQQQAQTPVCYNPGYVQSAESEYALQKNQLSRDCGIPVPASKPKIWSVADTVACKTPPPTAYLGQNFYPQQQQDSPSHLHAEQLQQQQQQQQAIVGSQSLQALQSSMTMGPQVELGSPLSMMSSYAAASPYSRIPTVYTEAMGMHIAAAAAGASGPVVNTSTKMPIHMHRELQQQVHSSISSSTQAPYLPPSHLQQHQQRVGFSEIQPDTPPQTPPNMKLISHSSSTNSNSNNNTSSSSS
ncbi:hypothetical protein KR222_011391, partial [Zaprionus bogoriensis]